MADKDEVTIDVPKSCLCSLSTYMVKKVGQEEFYKRIGMNDDTFSDFPLNMRNRYVWDVRRNKKNEYNGLVSDKLFFNIIRNERAPSIISSILNSYVSVQYRDGTKKHDMRNEHKAMAIFPQLTDKDVQRLVGIRFSKYKMDDVWYVLAAYIQYDYVPMLLKIPEAEKFVEERLKKGK